MLRGILCLLLAIQPPSRALLPSDSLSVADVSVKLNKHVSNYSLAVLTFVSALIRVSNDSEIPMGRTWVNSPAARTEFPLAWKDATVREVIQAIANTWTTPFVTCSL